jgi:hypothetical protein
MANSTIPNLVAVSVPALTDLFGVRQSGDSRDKKLTVTQLITLLPGGGDVTKVGTPVDNQIGVWTGDGTIEGDANFTWDGHLRIPQVNEAATPTFQIGATNTGLYGPVANVISVSIAGVQKWSFQADRINSAGSGGGIEFATPTATDPSLIPNVTDLDTGIGWNAADQLSLTAGGQEMARLTEGTGVNQFAIKQSGASTVPDLTSLGDPDTGFRWTGSNEIIAIHSNVRSWHFLQGSFFADASDGPILFNTFGSSTVPSICVERGDANTGLGAAGSDAMALISGGVPGLILKELNSGVIQAPNAGVAITAFATGGQGSATQLNQSNNVITTVATTGDSVKLPPVFLINSVIFVKNDGANAADVFPATGDDLGEGLNTAVSLASGASISFIATVANATWTQWIISVAGGGGIAAVVDDPSPQLGGNLDTNGFNIVNADTTLTSVSITAGTDPADEGGDLDLSSGDSGVGATGDAGAVNILAGESLATNGAGGVLSIKSGAGIGTGAGGDILIEVGEGGAPGPGTSGNFFLNTLTGANAAAGLQVPLPGLVAMYGVGRTGEGQAGNLELWGGYAAGTGGGSAGGNLSLFGGGQGGGSGVGGDARLIGGESDNNPGDASMRGGIATVSGSGGSALINGGAGTTGFAGGTVVIRGGFGAGTGNGGQTNLIGGQSGNGATGDGGNVEVVGGGGVSTAGAGGDATIASGVGISAGPDGDIFLKIGNNNQFEVDGTLALGFHAVNAGGPSILNELASATNPTVVPNRTDLDTGIGWNAADILSLIAGGDEIARAVEVPGANQLILSPTILDNNQAAPTLAFGDGNTGFFESSDNTLVVTTGAVQKFEWNSNFYRGVTSGSGALANEVASTTNPTLLPSSSDTDTGIGLAAADQVSIIGGGVELARAVEATGANQFIISPGATQNAPTTPSLAFGDGNTGFFESADNTLKIAVGNAARWQFQANNFLAENSAGPFMFNAAATSGTSPIMGPNRGDNNTGIGHGAADQLDLIAGSLNCITIRTVAAARQIGFYNATPVAQQTGVAVSTAAIHAALVSLGLITA